MASPQLKDGYMSIANEIMEALAQIRIPGEARQILDVILRKTYGWNKKEDEISLSQSKEKTGLLSPNIIRARNKLLIMNIPKGDGWEKLCNCLELWQPLEPFPHISEIYLHFYQCAKYPIP